MSVNNLLPVAKKKKRKFFFPSNSLTDSNTINIDDNKKNNIEQDIINDIELENNVQKLKKNTLKSSLSTSSLPTSSTTNLSSSMDELNYSSSENEMEDSLDSCLRYNEDDYEEEMGKLKEGIIKKEKINSSLQTLSNSSSLPILNNENKKKNKKKKEKSTLEKIAALNNSLNNAKIVKRKKHNIKTTGLL